MPLLIKLNMVKWSGVLWVYNVRRSLIWNQLEFEIFSNRKFYIMYTLYVHYNDDWIPKKDCVMVMWNEMFEWKYIILLYDVLVNRPHQKPEDVLYFNEYIGVKMAKNINSTGWCRCIWYRWCRALEVSVKSRKQFVIYSVKVSHQK